MVDSLDAVGTSLYEAKIGPPQLAARETIGALVEDAASKEGTQFLPGLSPHGVGASCGRLAVGHMGRLP